MIASSAWVVRESPTRRAGAHRNSSSILLTSQTLTRWERGMMRRSWTPNRSLLRYSSRREGRSRSSLYSSPSSRWAAHRCGTVILSVLGWSSPGSSWRTAARTPRGCSRNPYLCSQSCCHLESRTFLLRTSTLAERRRQCSTKRMSYFWNSPAPLLCLLRPWSDPP